MERGINAAFHCVKMYNMIKIAKNRIVMKDFREKKLQKNSFLLSCKHENMQGTELLLLEIQNKHGSEKQHFV